MDDSRLLDIKNQPTVFIIFGATGDLTRKRILPALFKLYKSNLLPKNFKIIAAARTSHTSENFRRIIEQSIGTTEKEKFPSFYRKIIYTPVNVAKDKNLTSIENTISEFEKEIKTCSQRIFYMAIAPDIFEKSIENFGKNKLNMSCQTLGHHSNRPRIIIEKPFGRSLNSARSLNTKLSRFFQENQIYRIDHYLGKETVQNIMAFRFGNEIFEPVWNRNYIDHIQITTAEHIGVEKRGSFYDKTGALRDITQNHLLQLLSLITMEEPSAFNPKEINERKMAVLKDVKTLTSQEIKTNTLRGQYEGYLNEENINPKSQTETYALMKLEIQNSRWKGVPIYLRTGKKLAGKVTSIILQFKDIKHQLFPDLLAKPTPNHITLQIQPNEGIGIRLAAKKPGLTTSIEPVDMEFCYKTSFDTPQPEAYERLMLDVILGDQSLFISQNVVEECWRIIDPIRNAWDKNIIPLSVYKPGSWGPKEADELIVRNDRQWLAPLLTICKI